MSIQPSKKSQLTLYIGIALIAGVIGGFILNRTYVGNENEQIAVAESKLVQLQGAMKSYEIVKDSTGYVRLLAIKKNIIDQKKLASSQLMASANQQAVVSQIKLLSDSLQSVNGMLTSFVDTSNVIYQELKKQRELVVLQKNDSLKQRDKKLEWFTILADIFLRLIKMIVAPLVFTTLVVGVAKLGDINSVGRIGGKTLLWFISASLMSLLLGMVLVNFFKPGIAMHLTLPEINANSGIDKAALTIKDFFYHVFPASFIDAMAKNEILQIVVFALFFGVAAAAIGELAKPVIHAIDVLAHIILKVTGYVMNFAPVAVFGAMTAIIAKQGIGILKTYSIFIGEFYFGLVYHLEHRLVHLDHLY
jgi:Na+/H+-dicarboxylate symporter